MTGSTVVPHFLHGTCIGSPRMPVTHTLEAIISYNTANHPAHQRHAAFTPACFALPSGTAPRKRTSHQGRANRRRYQEKCIYRIKNSIYRIKKEIFTELIKNIRCAMKSLGTPSRVGGRSSAGPLVPCSPLAHWSASPLVLWSFVPATTTTTTTTTTVTATTTTTTILLLL